LYKSLKRSAVVASCLQLMLEAEASLNICEFRPLNSNRSDVY